MTTRNLTLAENLDITRARPLAAELLALRGEDLTLDASAVQRVGGLCLQVLISAQSTWAEDGHVLAVAAPTPEFREGLALFGAADLTAAITEG